MTQFNPKEYWDNRLSEEYSLKGVGDIGLPISYNHFLYRVRKKAFRIAVKNIGVKGQNNLLNVLDVGSGTGFYIRQWKNYGVKSIVGSDITDTAILRLQKKYQDVEFIRQDIGCSLAETLDNRKFDVVTAFDMLFHIVNDSNYIKAILNFSNLVKKNGYLVFSDNLSPSSDIRLEHQVSRNVNEVFKLLSDNGFVLKKIVPMFVLMNDPVRTKSRLLKKFFSIVYSIASKGELQGKVLGGLLYIIDIVLIRIKQRGPSTEIFVWQKMD